MDRRLSSPVGLVSPSLTDLSMFPSASRGQHSLQRMKVGGPTSACFWLYFGLGTEPHGCLSGSCRDPHLRQIYTDPALTLAPPFRPEVKAYRAEVSFETVTVRIRAEAVSPACRVHVGGRQGPRWVSKH